MDWLIHLFTDNDSVAHIVLLYSLVIAIGVLLGKVKVGGISLGVTFVLFVSERSLKSSNGQLRTLSATNNGIDFSQWIQQISIQVAHDGQNYSQ